MAALSPPAATCCMRLACCTKLLPIWRTLSGSRKNSGLSRVSFQPLPVSVPGAKRAPNPELATAATTLADAATRAASKLLPSSSALILPMFQAMKV